MSVNARLVPLYVRLGAAMAGLVWVAAFGSSTAPIGANTVAANAAAVGAPAAPDRQATGSVSHGVARVLEVNGAIGPATSQYVTKALDAARVNGTRIVILQIDTPGGLDTAMRDIIRGILASPVPVVSYVSP